MLINFIIVNLLRFCNTRKEYIIVARFFLFFFTIYTFYRIKNKLIFVEIFSFCPLVDITKIEQLKLVFDFKTKKLPNDLKNLFQFNNEIHTHVTRNVKNEGLYVPQINTSSYGNNSIRYSAPVIWNSIIKYSNGINNIKTSSMFKSYLKKYYLSSYKNQN